MESKVVFVSERDRNWETWSEEQGGKGGNVQWKTMLSSHMTDSSQITLGILMVPASEILEEHRHAQAEAYFFLTGEGEVSVNGTAWRVGAGDTVFVPGGALHSCRNTGTDELRFAYVFPTDSFTDIEYDFGG